ncbi:aldehyde dehydrogenase 22A1 [Prunus yedoensis var. nudiflora]|uniref:Aldehyde dehydrogenase 22A1 n=1 Tax=Prunus yedoensis var. nudiflora TaxID=2094558 RepID=A0A314ZPK9_PRUYE|nr:aldehyde dehydrogenase 22A1 [Prunus yedoensis var. nudiflora]
MAVSDDGNQTQENGFIYVPPRGRTPQAETKVQCYEPATMKYLGYFPALTTDEVKERVAQARKAQKIWAKSSFKQRRQFLRILLKYIIEHQELICEISSRDTGKTMVDASLGEIMTTCEKITWLLSEGERWLKPEYRCSGRSMLHKKSKVEFHPLGVIGAIVSWNYPFHNIFNPMLAAVFSGNSIVIKVSEHASWSGCFYFRIIQSALAAVGAPENLVDVITGFAETGEALVSSVDKIIFVGSPGVGKMIMRNAAEMLIPVTLELGGKDAFIVCEDADVKHVAQIAVRAVLQSSGQNCAGAERFYVHKDIYSSFVSQVSKIVKSVTAGPPLAGNQRRAKEIASQIHCGVAAINDFASTYMCQSLPFGGVKDSGFGRFAGVEGLRACCLVKSVVEDRWWPYIKTKIPKPIQYPVGENGFEFQESLVEALYGMNIWDRLRALVNVLKILTEQNSPANSKRRDD